MPESCRVVDLTHPSGTADVCGKPATTVLVFKDGDKCPACQECAIRMREIARELHSDVESKDEKPTDL